MPEEWSMDDRSPSFSPELADQIAAELGQDEQLIWAGQPRLDLATRAKYFLVPFGVIFAGFALVWMIVAGFITFGLMAPCGLPFLAAGIALIASPAWLRSRARKTVYALTNQRAIIWEPGWFGSRTVRNYTSAGLGRISRTERPDGSGDLVFEEINTYHHNTDGHGTWHTTQRGFLSIDAVREVEALVRQTLVKER
jgi:hypothetical protein